MNETTTISATLEAVSKFTQDLETLLASIGTENRTLIILAVQELLVNIVQHAYDGNNGKIKFELNLSGQDLVIKISDQAAAAFEIPEDIPEPNPLDLPEHGMGLFIIYQTFDSVEYKHLPDGNQWQLTKKLG